MHNPFDTSQPELRSVSSGLVASDGAGTNCDIFEVIGHFIQKKLDNVYVLESWLKRSSQMRALVELENI